jgi:hypothetical protein
VGKKMGHILIPANLRPEDDEQPLLPFLLRTLKAIKLAGQDEESILEALRENHHVAFTLD